MSTILESYVLGRWQGGQGPLTPIHDATTEEEIARLGTAGIDFGAVLHHAREVGGPALRALGFAGRASMLRDLSARLHEHREELIEISIHNAGTTRSDAKFDIDGATGTVAAYAHFGKGLGDRPFLADGAGVQLGRTARFWGRHVLVPRRGVALHVNAFNFPAWNMFEKAACALLAGVPVVEKPGTPTAMVAWRMAQIAIESGVLPPGAFQFLAGSAGDLLDHVGPQDALAFTGSSATAQKLRSNPAIVRHGVHVNIEADSLNAAVLGPDVLPDTETWKLFVRTVVLETRQKTGQKCTAIRRVFVPEGQVPAVRDALVDALSRIEVGDPSASTTQMGPLASADQLRDVRAGILRLAKDSAVSTGGAEPLGERGYFVRPTLLVAKDARTSVFHEEEVFGPVATILPYDGSAAEAAELVALGQGGLVASVFSDDHGFTEEAALGMAPWSGRLWIGSEKVAEQAVPPGTVLPQSIHGGPGRAGGGEELGGLRGLSLYLQRTALQGYKGLVDGRFGPEVPPAEASRAEVSGPEARSGA